MLSDDTSLFPLELAMSIIFNDYHPVIAFEWYLTYYFETH